MARVLSSTEELPVKVRVQEELSPSCWPLKGIHPCGQPGGHAGSKISIRDFSLKLQNLWWVEG